MSFRRVFLILTNLLLVGYVKALWPLPQHMQTGATALRLASGFEIDISLSTIPDDLDDAMARTRSFLWNDKLERLVVGRGAFDNETILQAKTLRSLTLTLIGNEPIRSIFDESILPLDQRKESYTLQIPDDGTGASLIANSSLGLSRGLTTFTQLWYYYGGHVYMLEAPIQIDDSPLFVCVPSYLNRVNQQSLKTLVQPYRGLMLDTCRNLYAMPALIFVNG